MRRFAFTAVLMDVLRLYKCELQKESIEGKPICKMKCIQVLAKIDRFFLKSTESGKRIILCGEPLGFAGETKGLKIYKQKWDTIL